MFYYKDLEFETEGVYEPAEDSLLLAKAIENLDLEGKALLDMGCGSGFQGILAAAKGAIVKSVDINPDAVKITKYNAEANGVEINVRRSDLFGSVRGKFDYIIFNSPYLPVDDELPGKETWSGGQKLEVIEQFLSDAPKHLEKDGKILLLISSITGLDTVQGIAASYGLKSRVIEKEKVPWEFLYVLELQAEEDAV